jgi:hypothetical protein
MVTTCHQAKKADSADAEIQWFFSGGQTGTAIR